jgi:hypothetical protein
LITVPPGVDQWIWGVVSSERLTATLTEVKYSWTMKDLIDAHLWLDALANAREVPAREED